jgi:IS30 family transposase
MQYRQLSIEEREKIQLGLWAKRSIRDIAQELGRSPSTISRDISRSAPPINHQYTPRVAEVRAQENRASRGRTERLKNDTVRTYVTEQLKDGYSPEQIAGRLPDKHPGESISHEAIYRFVYSQIHLNGYGKVKEGCEDLRMYLKRRHKRRVPKGTRTCQRTPRLAGKSIDERPVEVETRLTIGHWEGDSVISRKSPVRLNTLVERKTGLVCITKIADGTAQETSNAVCERLGAFAPYLRKTLTVDNGTENAGGRQIERTLNLDYYLAHPYHSWERGTNENTNGLIRWYFPKGTDFATISDDMIRAVEHALNNRPRKRHGWKTPLEIFTQLQGVALEG